jgi:hypothetical protein
MAAKEALIVISGNTYNKEAFGVLPGDAFKWWLEYPAARALLTLPPELVSFFQVAAGSPIFCEYALPPPLGTTAGALPRAQA